MGPLGNCCDYGSTRFGFYDHGCTNWENYSTNGQGSYFRSQDSLQYEIERLNDSTFKMNYIWICKSCLMISISSIIYAIPHFTSKDTLPEFTNGTRDKFLCRDEKISNQHDSLLEYDNISDITESGKNTSVYGWVFLIAGICMGIASTSLWTKGYAAVESEATVEQGTCNITLMSIG